MKVVIAITCLTIGLAIGPGSGQSVQVKGDPQFQAWADQSLVATPGFKVYARNRGCPFITPPPGKVAACAQRYTVWVQLGYGGSQWKFLHELGHVIHRQWFKSLFWEPEEFAESFAQCAIYGEHGTQVHSVPAGFCRRLDLWIKRSPVRWQTVVKGQVR